VNKFGKVLAVAVLTCAAVGLTACNEKKSEETPAPAPAAETTPAPAAETPATPAAPAAETPATPAATPAPEEKKSEAAPEAAPSATEPAKTEESSPMAPETPAATPEPEKKSEAPSPSSTTADAPAAPAADEKPQQSADAAAAPADAAPADAKPADAAAAGDIKDRTSPPDPVSELAKSQGFKFEDGRYRNKDGDPQYVVTQDYMVDWGTWNGFRRYHDACHVCHGPNALGSTFAPALADSLKTMDYSTFIATVSGGRTVNRAGTTYVMPAFGSDRNIMCYIDDIYTYIKARSTDAMPPGRPNAREDVSPETQKAANDCTG
jgi:methanol metabolism-related c-type cytochrome